MVQVGEWLQHLLESRLKPINARFLLVAPEELRYDVPALAIDQLVVADLARVRRQCMVLV